VNSIVKLFSKMNLKLLVASISASLTFVACHIWQLTLENFEQYLAVVAVISLDGFFGVIAGVKREGFKTHKALKMLKTLFAWITILTALILIENGIKGTFWLSETFLLPFIVITLASIVKNANLAGFIDYTLANQILDKLDTHKGERIPRKKK
jgi:hypothetical protein